MISSADLMEIQKSKEKILDEFQDYIKRCAAEAACTSDYEDCYILSMVLVLASGGERIETFDTFSF